MRASHQGQDDDTVVLAPTLDSLIAEHEKMGQHIDGGVCEFRLGSGMPLSKTRCLMCVKLSALIDLSSSWSQRIDTGRLIGRSVEVVTIANARNIRDAESAWRLYRECDTAQRESQQCFVRRYYASFTCNGSHYVLRDVTHATTPPLDVMVAQLVELFSNPNALPPNFVHGNPTAASISFAVRLPVALRHKITISGSTAEDISYASRYLVQLDYGGVESTAITASRRRNALEETLGVITVNEALGTISVRSDASFISFLREYPRHANQIALLLLLRGLLSFYPSADRRDYADAIPLGASDAANLHEAFEELKGKTFPRDVITLLLPRIRKLGHSPV